MGTTNIKVGMAYKYLLLIVTVITSVWLHTVLLSLILFSILILWDRRFIISILLFVPSMETIMVVTQGFSITKLLAIIIGIYLLIYLLFNKPRLDKTAGLISFFICLTLLATLYGMVGLSHAKALGALSHYSTLILPKLLFVLLLYLFLKEKGSSFIKGNLQVAVIAIPLSLIILTAYFIGWGYQENDWWNVVRRTFEGADPNEFGCILDMLGVFPLYLLIHSKQKLYKAIALCAIVLLAYAVSLTLSRGAMLSFIFMLLVTSTVITKFSFSKVTKYSLVGLFGILLLVQFGIIDLYAIQQRFFGIHVNNISSLTASRSNLWTAGLHAFVKRPLIGYGNTPNTSININMKALSSFHVMHDAYLEYMVRMGLVGLITFLLILINSQTGIIQYLKLGNKQKDALYLLPMIALLVMCFSAFALSWQWRELLWYLIAISLAVSKLKLIGEQKGLT